jgi:cellulase/cellobiase CelA1
VVGQWPGAFQGEVTVRNAGTAAINSWTVRWTFANGQVVSQLWGGVPTQSGASVSVRNETWNGMLGPNASTTFGFLASWSTTNSVPTNVSCTSP